VLAANLQVSVNCRWDGKVPDHSKGEGKMNELAMYPRGDAWRVTWVADGVEHVLADGVTESQADAVCAQFEAVA
jgi:hypothetical protein